MGLVYDILRTSISRKTPWGGNGRSIHSWTPSGNGPTPEMLAEARKWHQTFKLSSIPEGKTTYSRSSGPGGQHVNKCVIG
jgi:hypothetical protein